MTGANTEATGTATPMTAAGSAEAGWPRVPGADRRLHGGRNRCRPRLRQLGLLADAAHMLTGAVAIGLSLFAMWVANRPASIERAFGYHRTEALANELAARYLLNHGQNDAARSYLRSAMEQYEALGAKRKVAHLKSRYPGPIADNRA